MGRSVFHAGSREMTRKNAPLQTAEQRGKMRGRAFSYARGLLLDPEAMGVGRPPFSHIDGETIAQRSWVDGYTAALRDVRKSKVTL